MLAATQSDIDPDHFLTEDENEGEWVVKSGSSGQLPARYSKHGIETESRYIKPPRMLEIPDKYLFYEKAEVLATEINLEPGGRHYALINGTFIFGDFIEALLVQKSWQAKTMTISTLSMSENNIDSLANLIEGDFILELNLIVSDYFFSHERFGLVPYIYQKLDVGNRFQFSVAGTHCKLCIFETTCGKQIVIHGSANLRSSASIEQFMVEWNPELYEFNDRFQRRIVEQFKTINKGPLAQLSADETPGKALKSIKPLRHSKLWHLVAQDTNL